MKSSLSPDPTDVNPLYQHILRTSFQDIIDKDFPPNCQTAQTLQTISSRIEQNLLRDPNYYKPIYHKP